MELTQEYKDKVPGLLKVFEESFGTLEGPEEGRAIKSLVADMLATLGPGDLHVITAVEDGAVRGAVLFTRMTFAEDAREVSILSPAAVATDRQGKGLGQRLIQHGLQVLREAGVDVVLTYGDINFYAKVGFAQITQAEARAPQPLIYPEGWLGQSLAGGAFEPLNGASACVAPLNKPEYW